MTRPALLLVNTRSRQGADAAATVASALDRAGVPVLQRSCADAGQLPGLIRSLAAAWPHPARHGK